MKIFNQLVMYEHLTTAQKIEVKREAIRWIKAYKTNMMPDMESSECMSPTVVDWIKYYHSITEEDLKWE